jgi:hypothetical protein
LGSLKGRQIDAGRRVPQLETAQANRSRLLQPGSHRHSITRRDCDDVDLC